MSKLIVMERLRKYELKTIAKNKGIKNYQNMSRENLLSVIDEYDCILENLLQKRLERMAEMQNLSLNDLKKIAKMQNLSQNALEQIARTRLIKNYNNMSREELLIALLKSKQSHAELYNSRSNSVEIEETKKFFNEIRNKLSK